MSKSNCPKCNGTGFVAAFAHVKDGVCFDCNGTGSVSAAIVRVIPKLGAPGISGLKAASLIGDAVLADPTAVGRDIAAIAVKTYEDSNVLNAGRQRDHDRYRALRAIAQG